jgi:hypothetical protein
MAKFTIDSREILSSLMEDLGLIYSGSDVTDPEIFDAVPREYQYFLGRMNGCILFDGGLHIRGAVQSPEWHSLRKVWRGDVALCKLFPAVKESDVPFAQDCLGDQFFLRSGVVHELHAESGDLASLEMGLEVFLDSARADPVEFLSLQPLLKFMAEGGRMKPGQLLNAYPPYIMKESGSGVSLKAISMLEQISFLADLARQLRDVPEGSKVKIIVTKIPSGEG